jgi:hypothetical protein
MIAIRRSSTSEDVRQSAKHTLLVEGKGPDALDPRVLGELFRDRIRIEPLGASFHVASAAEALHPSHPYYYFLIDRDHHDDEYVERSWQNFPDPDKANLLVWRRRELENYFLIPDYASTCEWLTVSRDELQTAILRTCQRRLYLDAANRVIVGLREELKQKWIETFDKVDEFPDKTAALHKLRSIAEFKTHATRVKNLLTKREVNSRFDKALNELTGNRESLTYGKGTWLEILQGKAVFSAVVNACFKVRNAKGRFLQGVEARKQVARSLLQLPLEDQPTDFQQLYKLIDKTIRST